jgi:hypothetical protein
MIKRCIAASLCLLFLSVSTVFSAVHKHQADPVSGHTQCAACLWHAETVSDVPTTISLIPSSTILCVAFEREHFSATEQTLLIHPSRGPPALSL